MTRWTDTLPEVGKLTRTREPAPLPLPEVAHLPRHLRRRRLHPALPRLPASDREMHMLTLTVACPDCGVSECFDGIDDFAGPGGWDQGARMVGLRLLGHEWDTAACATANAAGHARLRTDVTASDHPGRVPIYVGSPPCTLFSVAGSGVGRLVLDVLADGIVGILRGQDPSQVRAAVRAAIHPVTLAEAEAKNSRRKEDRLWPPERLHATAQRDAATAALVLEPARRIMANRPDLLALEQVPAVLPLWQVYAHELRRLGYSAWAGVLCAADYGVPQTRRRAILVASRVSPAKPPAPTHCEHPQGDDLFGTSLRPWVSMAEALGWGWDDEPSATVSGGGTATGGAEPFANAAYRRRLRDFVVDRRTSNGNQPNAARRSIDEPAPTILFGHNSNETRWVFDRPATTVVGSFRPDVIAAPGYRTEESRQDAPGSVSVSVSVSEAGVLQTFPPDYPWRGSRSKRYEQVGNAVPPLMAAHILAALTGRTPPAAHALHLLGVGAASDVGVLR